MLKDLIQSGVIPVARLQKVFRQDAKSAIVNAAADILAGKVPLLPTPADSKGRNCVFVSAEDPEKLKESLVHLVMKALPAIGFEQADIQVLSPQWEKGVGVNNLNPILQNAINPPDGWKTEISLSGNRKLRVGDRVIQTKNNYDKGVFNGDIGTVASIDNVDDTSTVFVEYPDQAGLVDYEQGDLDEINLSYAMTTHKSQGSEYPVVIVVMHPLHWTMLRRNLLYTALTRARKLCIVLGTRGAMETAVENALEQVRNTCLSLRVKAYVAHYK